MLVIVCIINFYSGYGLGFQKPSLSICAHFYAECLELLSPEIICLYFAESNWNLCVVSRAYYTEVNRYQLLLEIRFFHPAEVNIHMFVLSRRK